MYFYNTKNFRAKVKLLFLDFIKRPKGILTLACSEPVYASHRSSKSKGKADSAEEPRNKLKKHPLNQQKNLSSIYPQLKKIIFLKSFYFFLRTGNIFFI